MIVAKDKKIPVVYEIRAFWEDAAVDHGTCREGDFRYTLTRALENYVVKHAAAVTTICKGLQQDLIKRGVAKTKLTEIPNAVEIEKFTEKEVNAKREAEAAQAVADAEAAEAAANAPEEAETTEAVEAEATTEEVVAEETAAEGEAEEKTEV